MTWPRVIAISGTSNLGKSTLAAELSDGLAWPFISTDKLAKHPGRPWSPTEGGRLPPHVVDHYERHSADSLADEQIAHFRRIEPVVTDAVETALAMHPSGVIVEGSAILPGRTPWLEEAYLTVLVGSSNLIWARIRHESRYESQPDTAQMLIQRFRDRSVLYQQRILDALPPDDPCILSADLPVEQLADNLLARCARIALASPRQDRPGHDGPIVGTNDRFCCC